MNLNLPVPTVTNGPQWANEVNDSFDTVDAHDHTPGKGAPIPSQALNITDDLEFNNNGATELSKTQFQNKPAVDAGLLNAGSLQVINGDIWFVNGGGAAVQVTSGLSVVAPSSPLVPSGVIWPYGGASAPSGFLLCNGSAVSRTTFAALFAAIGVSFGPGDGSTTFNLPDMQGRVPMGTGTYTDPNSGSVTRTLAQTLGSDVHTLSEAEMPSHTHIQDAHGHPIAATQGSSNAQLPNATGVAGWDNGRIGYTILDGTGTRVIDLVTPTNQSTGGSQSHPNMQPSIGLSYIIKT